jgi:hypothetical protein
MCLRGASAVEQVLERHPDWKVRVFVVWEAVRKQDRKGPPNGTYGRIPDLRVVQYWDPGLKLSKRIVHDMLANPSLQPKDETITDKTIAWDFAAIYPPGVRWEKEFPAPKYYGKPVVRVDRDVELELEALNPAK